MQCLVRGKASSAANTIGNFFSSYVNQNGSLEEDRAFGFGKFKLQFDWAKLKTEFLNTLRH